MEMTTTTTMMMMWNTEDHRHHHHRHHQHHHHHHLRHNDYPTTTNDTDRVASFSFPNFLIATSTPSSVDDTFFLWRNVAIATVCLIIIVGTVVGNSLVCLAVAMVRKLQTPSNLLIVSLAVSDLLVAVLVMPFALLMELSEGHWPLGEGMCKAWTSLDVLLCTASILNLCFISIDRYLAITRPLRYATKRTLPRMTGMSIAAWLVAALISIPPLFGWAVEYHEGQCQINQSVGYQIYATVGAFYLPLTIMVVIYCRIYRVTQRLRKADLPSNEVLILAAATRRRRLEHVRTPLLLSSREMTTQQQKTRLSCSSDSAVPCRGYHTSGRRSSSSSVFFPQYQSKVQLCSEYVCSGCFRYKSTRSRRSSMGGVSTTTESSSPEGLYPWSKFNCLFLNYCCGSSNWEREDKSKVVTELDRPQDECISRESSLIPSGHALLRPGYPKCKRPSLDSTPSSSSFARKQRLKSCCLSQQHQRQFQKQILQNNKQESSRTLAKVLLANSQVTKKRVTRFWESTQKTNSMPRDRKATKTLGVIMGAFTLCWLPFFIVALIKPFCIYFGSSYNYDPNLCSVNSTTFCDDRMAEDEEPCIPEWVSSLFLWLGYANSLSNPIIYARFNRDFRSPFRLILACSCRSINNRMRSESYADQYGINNSVPGAPNYQSFNQADFLANHGRGKASDLLKDTVLVNPYADSSLADSSSAVNISTTRIGATRLLCGSDEEGMQTLSVPESTSKIQSIKLSPLSSKAGGECANERTKRIDSSVEVMAAHAASPSKANVVGLSSLPDLSPSKESSHRSNRMTDSLNINSDWNRNIRGSDLPFRRYRSDGQNLGNGAFKAVKMKSGLDMKPSNMSDQHLTELKKGERNIPFEKFLFKDVVSSSSSLIFHKRKVEASKATESIPHSSSCLTTSSILYPPLTFLSSSSSSSSLLLFPHVIGNHATPFATHVQTISSCSPPSLSEEHVSLSVISSSESSSEATLALLFRQNPKVTRNSSTRSASITSGGINTTPGAESISTTSSSVCNPSFNVLSDSRIMGSINSPTMAPLQSTIYNHHSITPSTSIIVPALASGSARCLPNVMEYTPQISTQIGKSLECSNHSSGADLAREDLIINDLGITPTDQNRTQRRKARRNMTDDKNNNGNSNKNIINIKNCMNNKNRDVIDMYAEASSRAASSSEVHAAQATPKLLLAAHDVNPNEPIWIKLCGVKESKVANNFVAKARLSSPPSFVTLSSKTPATSTKPILPITFSTIRQSPTPSCNSKISVNSPWVVKAFDMALVKEENRRRNETVFPRKCNSRSPPPPSGNNHVMKSGKFPTNENRLTRSYDDIVATCDL